MNKWMVRLLVLLLSVITSVLVSLLVLGNRGRVTREVDSHLAREGELAHKICVRFYDNFSYPYSDCIRDVLNLAKESSENE